IDVLKGQAAGALAGAVEAQEAHFGVLAIVSTDDVNDGLGRQDIGEITVIEPFLNGRIIGRRAILRMHIIDKLCLVRDFRDCGKVALCETQQGSLSCRVGIPAVSFDDVALERQVPGVSLGVLYGYHRTTCKIKIHPDVSGARIESVRDGSNQTWPHILRLRWRGLVGGRSGIVLAHSSPTTTRQEEQTHPQADEALETLPRHAALLASG